MSYHQYKITIVNFKKVPRLSYIYNGNTINGNTVFILKQDPRSPTHNKSRYWNMVSANFIISDWGNGLALFNTMHLPEPLLTNFSKILIENKLTHNISSIWNVITSLAVISATLQYSDMKIIFLLAHWGQDRMAASSQMTFSNPFSSMKMHRFCLIFHWSLFPMVQLTIFQHWFSWCLGAGQATSHYLNQWWLVCRHTYALPP